jgi:hypothetical protein
MTLPLAFFALAGCGDPILPGGFVGSPVSAVTGNVDAGVAGIGGNAERPQMALVWLVGQDLTADSLLSQSITYRRSLKLQHDWDIGLFRPIEGAAQRVVEVEAGVAARIGVAKMVYFDDRNHNDTLDWTCSGARCDRVLAVSDQFVLFVDRSAYCQEPGKAAQERLAAGYHYYAYDPVKMNMRQLGITESMSFTIVDRSPADSLPTAELNEFTSQLQRAWHLGINGGCQ